MSTNIAPTLAAELAEIETSLRNHRCGEATRVFDAYCGCETLREDALRLWINIEHPHGAGLAADDYRRDYLFEYVMPSRWGWEEATYAALWDSAPPF